MKWILLVIMLVLVPFPVLGQGKSPDWFTNKAVRPAGENVIGGAPINNWGTTEYFVDIDDALLDDPTISLSVIWEISCNGEPWRFDAGGPQDTGASARSLKPRIPGAMTSSSTPRQNCRGRIRVIANKTLAFGGAAGDSSR